MRSGAIHDNKDETLRVASLLPTAERLNAIAPTFLGLIQASIRPLECCLRQLAFTVTTSHTDGNRDEADLRNLASREGDSNTLCDS